MITAFAYSYCFAVAGTALFLLIFNDPWKGHID